MHIQGSLPVRQEVEPAASASASTPGSTATDEVALASQRALLNQPAFLQTALAGKARGRLRSRAAEREQLVTQAKTRMYLRFLARNPIAGALKPLADVRLFSSVFLFRYGHSRMLSA